jgi:hypothetical protein
VFDELAERLHRQGVRFGVICNGNPGELNNDAWINEALQHCRAIDADPRVNAQDFIVQSRTPAPTEMLPETDPGTLTCAARQVEATLHGRGKPGSRPRPGQEP